MCSPLAIIVIAAVIVVAVFAVRHVREHFEDRRYGLFSFPFRYDPARVSGHEVVMWPNLFGGV